MSTEPSFPDLPGEPYAEAYWGEDNPPAHVMVTLEMLSRGHLPAHPPPEEWVSGVGLGQLNAGISDFAGRRLGLYCLGGSGRKIEWHREELDADGVRTARPVTREYVLQACWTEYSLHLLEALTARCASPAEAHNTLEREWRLAAAARNARRLNEFNTVWREASAWPPALALSWITFGGDWSAMAEALDYGNDIPCDRDQLVVWAALFRHKPAAVVLTPCEDLWRHVRKAVGNRTRVIVSGLSESSGQVVEISPAELMTLEWTNAHYTSQGAALGRNGQRAYSGVQIDAASLQNAFPSRDAPTVEPSITKAEAIRRAAKALNVLPSWRVDKRTEDIGAWIKAQEDLKWFRPLPARTQIGEALAGTVHIRSSGKRRPIR